LLGDMYFALHDYSNALTSYEAVLKKTPNRLNSVKNAGKAAAKLGDAKKANDYYQQLRGLREKREKELLLRKYFSHRGSGANRGAKRG
ncbi:MAG TPA: hypothetical protein VL307_09730, partial [Chitinophagaceae bacterium]|nr:hypothetical protein [Chitinophagaceae bacterium]